MFYSTTIKVMCKKYTILHNINNELYKNNILIWNRNHNPHQIVQRSNTRKVIVKTQEIKAKKIYIGVQNGVEFHGKPILIEVARSQPTQNLNFNTRLRNTQNPQNLPSSKEPQKNPPPIPPKQNTYNNYSGAFKPRKKSIVFFSNSIPKNLKMKDFNAAVRGEEFIFSLFLVRKQYNSTIT